MFFNKTAPSPRGVPLAMLAGLFKASNVKCRRNGDALFVENGGLVTAIAVEPPISDGEPAISAVVKIRTELEGEVARAALDPKLREVMNRMATLAAVTWDKTGVYIGSRLTVFEKEDAWGLQLPMTFCAAIVGAHALIGAVRRSLSGEGSRDSVVSAWTGHDFAQAERHLSQRSFCNADANGLTAEFALRRGETSTMAGDMRTALWQMKADSPHPEAGGGLFCLLSLPHRIDNEQKLDEVIADLNRMEMTGDDLPPHFGAWCRGQLGNNPAYVSFLPNSLHDVAGIAVNVSNWAMFRAHVVDARLQLMGLS